MLKLCIGVVITLLVALPAYGGQGEDWKKTLKSNLEAVYKPTALGRRGFFDRPVSGGRPPSIVESEGTILVVQKPGILGGLGSYGVIRVCTVRNGALTRAYQTADDGQYLFKVGDRVYIEKIDVDDNAIAFRLWTAEPVERVVRGSTMSERFTVQVKFEFDRGLLATLDSTSLQRTIGDFLKLEEDTKRPKTLTLGQSVAEVEAILGKPTTVIDLGARKTYVYPNMRVIFTDGKVSDVQ